MTNQKHPVPPYVRRLVGEVRVYIDVNRFCNSDEEAAERIAANANWVIDRIRDNALDAAFLAPSSTDADGNNGYFRVEVSPIDPGYATLVATTKPFVSDRKSVV